MKAKIKKELTWIRKTQSTYNLIAQKFSETRKKKDEVLDFFFSQFSPRGRTLEIGCGPARSVTYLKKQRFFKNPKNSYLGIDYSAKLLFEAKKQRETKLYKKNIDFQKKNLLNLNYKNQFDSIFGLAVIHHLPKSFQLSVLKKIYQALKKNGIFAGYIWTPGEKITKKWQKIGEKSYFKFWEGNPKLPIFYYYFTKKDLRELLKKVGFKKIKLLKSASRQKSKFFKIKKNLFFFAYKN